MIIANIEATDTSLNFLWHIYLPIGIWLFAVIFLIIALLIKFTFGKWEKKPNPYATETLAIPRGVFRGILTLTLLFIVVIFESYNLFKGNNEDNIVEFLTAFKMMIAFYFGSKVAHHVTTVDKHKAKLKNEADKDKLQEIDTSEMNEDEYEYEHMDSSFYDEESAG